MISAYIAAPYPCRADAIAVMHACEARGIVVTSRWLTGAFAESDEEARKDLADIESADWLVALNPPEWAEKGTGGRHAEMGYALAKGKPILLIGIRSNVFHFHSDIARIAEADPETIATLLAAVSGGR